MENVNQVFTNIQEAFAAEGEMWNRAITTFQMPMRSPPRTCAIEAALVYTTEPWHEKIPQRHQPSILRQQSSSRKPEPLGDTLDWRPIFDNDNGPWPSESS